MPHVGSIGEYRVWTSQLCKYLLLDTDTTHTDFMEFCYYDMKLNIWADTWILKICSFGTKLLVANKDCASLYIDLHYLGGAFQGENALYYNTDS